jgi:hypothetical protein
MALVKTVRSSIAAIEGAPEALAESMSDALYFDQRWSALIDLHEVWPDLFTSPRWEELRQQCEAWVVRSLTAVEDFRDVEEVDEVITIAERMEVPLDEDLVRETRDEVWAQRGSRDDHPDYEPPETDLDESEPSEEERVQVHEAFARFVEGADDSENGVAEG